MIALEPEAASLFCKYLPIEKLQGSEGGIGAFKPGSRYLVLDAGGKQGWYKLQNNDTVA